MAGAPVSEYSISGGRKWLENLADPSTPSGWAAEGIYFDADWSAIWLTLAKLRSVVVPAHWVVWWRFLRHNVMTANRTAHMIEGGSSDCHHCLYDGAEGVVQTPGHLLVGCSSSFGLWRKVLNVSVGDGGLLGLHLVPRCLLPFLFLDHRGVSQEWCALTHSVALWVLMAAHWGVVFDDLHHRFTTDSLWGSWKALVLALVQGRWWHARRHQNFDTFDRLWISGSQGTLVRTLVGVGWKVGIG